MFTSLAFAIGAYAVAFIALIAACVALGIAKALLERVRYLENSTVVAETEGSLRRFRRPRHEFSKDLDDTIPF